MAAILPTFLHVAITILIAVANDIRDRTTPEYRSFAQRLVADLRERGVQIPLICYREGDRLRIVDGMTRYLCSIEAGVQTVPVLVYETKPEDDELELAQVQANAMRSDLSDLDYARIYLHYKVKRGWGQAEIARRLHHDPGTVSKRLQVLGKFPSDLHGLIGEGVNKIPFSCAYQLSRLEDEAKVRDLAEKIRDGKLTRDDVDEVVSAVLRVRTPKALKPVKVSTPQGVEVLLPRLDASEVLAELELVTDAVERVRKSGLPLSNVASFLKS